MRLAKVCLMSVILLISMKAFAADGDLTVQGNIGIGTTTPEASLDVQGDVKMFGTWDNTKAVNTVYQAETDGFVLAWGYNTTSYITLNGYTDGNNPPTTEVARQQSYTSAWVVYFMFPVRKGDYWKVKSNGTSNNLYWLPLGGNQ